MIDTKTVSPSTFDGLGLAPLFLDVLAKHKITVPSPIQAKAIPLALTGSDVIGIAQTGTGKTLAFGLPMIQRLAQHKGMGLVLVPTRELAAQVDENLHSVGAALGLRTAVIVGGAAMGKQIQMLRSKPHIIVATPGRLNDHLQQKTVDLSSVAILVLDEADRMLDMGFEPQIQRILATVPKLRQTLLFSATMPPRIKTITTNYMRSPQTVEVERAGTSATNVSQEVYIIRKEDKGRLLERLLKDHSGTILVFSRTKHGAKKISRHVQDMGHTSADIHSNRSLVQRKQALDGFKTGKYRVLVATDIAARGIDVNDIEVVINYDLPDNPEDYVHRIGRTGRAGKSGKAISFAEHNQRYDLKTIERLIRKDLREVSIPELPPSRVQAIADRPERSFRPQRSSYGRRPTQSIGQRSYAGGGQRSWR